MPSQKNSNQDKPKEKQATQEAIDKFKKHALGPRPKVRFLAGRSEFFMFMGLSPNFAKERNMDWDQIEDDISTRQIDMDKHHWQ
ncbi:hypothetical protein ABG067_009259, partial [Albugo candida]